MNSNKGSVLRGAVALLFGSIAMFLGGGILLMLGLDALGSGEVSVGSLKGDSASLLHPAINPWRFYAEVWGRLVLGGLLVACSIGVPLFLLASPSARRTERLLNASFVRVQHGGPNVSLLVALLVIVAFFVILVGAVLWRSN